MQIKKYVGLYVNGGAEMTTLQAQLPQGIQMPCGHVTQIAGADQPCPGSGKCPQGYGECWAEAHYPK